MEEKELNVRGRSRAKNGSKAAVNNTAEAEKKAEAAEINLKEANTFSQNNNENEETEPKKKNGGKIAAGVLAAAVIAAVGGYVGYAQQFKNVYFPNTTINGIDASGKTAAEVEQLIADEIQGYTMNITGREGTAETIKGSDVDLHAVFDGSFGRMLAAQNPYEWIAHMTGSTGMISETAVEFDEAKLAEVVKALGCMDPNNMKKPEDAKLSDYVAGQGFTIVPETAGTEIDGALMQQAVKDSISILQAELNLDEAGVYTEAAVKSDDAKLIEECENANKMANVSVTYKFGDTTEVCDGTVIKEWIVKNGNDLAIDEEKAAEYVKELAEKYDTYNKPKVFTSTEGDVVEITKGSYGWKMDQEQTKAALLETIAAGKDVEAEPVYLQEAAAHGDQCWGDTYVEVNLTKQHLYYYKKGELVVETDFVSGNSGRGTGTPSGAYSIAYTQRNAVLRGPGYASPVSYWMPFNGGVGLHDATWRGAFGGNIYKTNGSHGCVNLPVSAAKKIFENIEKGCPVLCFVLNGEEHNTSKTFAPAPKQTAPAPTAAPAAPVEVPQETAPAAPVLSGPGGQAPTQAATGPGAAPAPQETLPPPPQPALPALPQPGVGPAGPGM